MKLKDFIKIAVIASRNLIMGGNLVSLAFLKSPSKMVGYVSENLFLYKTMGSKEHEIYAVPGGSLAFMVV